MSIQSFQQELDSFPEREQGLKKVKRYSLYHTMYYRTDLWTHTLRVAWIVEEMLPLAQKIFGTSFDPEKAIAIALVHDDAETVFGDVQAGNKAKMSKEELEKVEGQELRAIEELSKRSPEQLGKYSYKELLMEPVDKTSLESMIVSWADKYDAFCEALHELYAGNTLWSVNVQNEYGKIDTPIEYYMKYFKSFEQKFPNSKELFSEHTIWFSVPEEPDVSKLTKGTEHTKQSLSMSKGYVPYDQWVALTLEKGSPEDITNLYTRKEQ